MSRFKTDIYVISTKPFLRKVKSRLPFIHSFFGHKRIDLIQISWKKTWPQTGYLICKANFQFIFFTHCLDFLHEILLQLFIHDLSMFETLIHLCMNEMVRVSSYKLLLLSDQTWSVAVIQMTLSDNSLGRQTEFIGWSYQRDIIQLWEDVYFELNKWKSLLIIVFILFLVFHWPDRNQRVKGFDTCTQIVNDGLNIIITTVWF